MADYILLMHNDATSNEGDWQPYLQALQASGRFRGGSALGGGECVRKAGPLAPLSAGLTGFIRVEADDLVQVRALLAGNPVYEAGGTVEIRELPQTD
ncbi:MAG: YciI family protein [Hyphomicrobiaceae bacterium]